MVDFRFLNLNQVHLANGMVVVIDVVRAFTTAATAFDCGAQRIILCADVDEAFRLRDKIPGSLIMGELGGQRVVGFDMWNSPREIAKRQLTGATLIQRTSAGTQGAVAASGAHDLVAAGFVNCKATAMFIQKKNVDHVDVIITGSNSLGGGLEDKACGDYLEALINKKRPNPVKYREEAARLIPILLQDGSGLAWDISADVAECLSVDRFNFVMRIEKHEGLLEMRPTLI